jgi:hypothetical protein
MLSLWRSWEALTLHVLSAGLLFFVIVAVLWLVIVLPLIWIGVRSGKFE